MPNIVATLNLLQLPPIERSFIDSPSENARDVVTLNGNIYTDFISLQRTWTFNYGNISKEQYDDIRAEYDAQFTSFQFPELTIPFYGVADQPVRMYINDKNIWDDCGRVAGLQIRFRETVQQDVVS